MTESTQYRLDKSAGCLRDSKFLLDNGSFDGSINRSYYAMFTIIRALLAEEDIDFSKHSAVIGYFRREYIKTGVFDKKFSDYIGKAFIRRNDCDYRDFVFISREEAETQYLHAVEFFETIKNYLETLEK